MWLTLLTMGSAIKEIPKMETAQSTLAPKGKAS